MEESRQILGEEIDMSQPLANGEPGLYQGIVTAEEDRYVTSCPTRPLGEERVQIVRGRALNDDFGVIPGCPPRAM
jgi:hypothetical protein